MVWLRRNDNLKGGGRQAGAWGETADARVRAAELSPWAAAIASGAPARSLPLSHSALLQVVAVPIVQMSETES